MNDQFDGTFSNLDQGQELIKDEKLAAEEIDKIL